MPPPDSTRLGPGDVLYTVLVASPVLQADGSTKYDTFGPWNALNLGAASMFAQSRPGSLLAVTTVLHEAPPLPAAAAAPDATLRRRA